MKITRRAMHVASPRKQESINLAMTGMREIMRMKKLRWEHHALPGGFAGQKYPRDSSYLMISKNMVDRRNPNLG
jgi:hypothetical protein